MSAEFPIDPQFRGPRRTICEVLREMHRLVEAGETVPVLPLINEAHDMAKRMDRRLKQYKADWDRDGFWPEA